MQFYFDLLASIPFLYLFWNIQHLQVFQLLKILRLQKCSVVLKSLNLTNRVRKITKVLISIFFLTIVVLSSGCIWLSVSSMSQEWLPLIYQIKSNHSGRYLTLQEHSKVEQFFLCLVYSNIMVISEGEVFPSDLAQTILASLALFLGSFIDAILFGFMVENILQANSRRKAADQLHSYQMQMASNLMLSRRKRASLVQFLHSSSISQEYLQQLKDFLNFLSPTLKQIVVRDITKQALANCIIYQNIIYSHSVAQELQLQLKLPEEIIFDYEAPANGVFFLIRGEVDLQSPRISQPGYKVKKALTEGSYFGQIALILNTTRTLRAQCSGLSYTTLGFLSSRVIQRELWNNAKAKFIVTRGIAKYKDPMNKKIEHYLQKTKLFKPEFLAHFQNELFKFKIKHYVPGSFIWTPIQPVRGFSVILKGQVTFLIKIQNFLVPVYSTGDHDVIGYEHSLFDTTHQTYLRADKLVTVAFYAGSDLMEFRKQNGLVDRLLEEEQQQIDGSLLRPRPIDVRKRGLSR